MRFLNQPKSNAIKAIAQTLCDGLFAGKRVLWLVSGGSNVAVEVEVMKLLHAHAADRLGGLAVLPMDERYGVPGHANSNTQQLRTAGFEPGMAIWIDVLARNLPFEQTVEFYRQAAAIALSNADLIVGQFGMGADAHIAGLLPESPAVTMDGATVVGYEWSDYTRLTLAPAALKQVNVAFVVAYGDDKKAAFTRLRGNKQSFAKLPAKLLYELPQVTVYNDQLESEG